jgi:hypothetical protein
MIDKTQDPSAGFSSRPAGAPPRIPGTNGGQAGTEANRATVRAAFQAWQDGTGTITSLGSRLAWRAPAGHVRTFRPGPQARAVAGPCAAQVPGRATASCPRAGQRPERGA